MRHLTTLIALLILAIPVPLAAQPAKPFRAGAATSNITPPIGSAIIGGFVPFPSTHVHDELHARCLVLDDGSTKLVFVVCDLLGIDRLVSDEARAILQQDLKIPKENVLISATHTHSAASAIGTSPFVVNDTMDDYQRFVARRIVDGVKRAHNLLRPAQIGIGAVDVPEHVFNRRWKMKEGAIPLNPFGGVDKVKMNPPMESPDLVEPAGPTDPTIPFIAVKEPAGKPIGVFSTYSLHYVGGVGPGHISADYFAMYCEELTRLLKADSQTPAFVAMMANGTSGDINNINFRKSRGKQQPYQQMKYVADDVARKVHAALGKITYHDHMTLAARYRDLPIRTRRPTAEQVDWAKKLLADPPKGVTKTSLPYIYAGRALEMAKNPETMKLPIQAFRVGETALGTMPCEIFCEIGLDFKQKSTLKPAWLVSLNHGYFGYLPTPRQHELGGYETWLATNRLEIQASDKLEAALLEMVQEMTPRQPRLPCDNLMLYRGPDGKPAAVKSLDDWGRRRAEISAGVEAVMGKLPGKEKRCPLDVKIEEEVDCGTFVRRLISYQSEPGGRVPAYLLIPKDAQAGKGKVPAVLCLHPTNNKIGHGVVVGLGDAKNRAYAKELAERGYVTLAPSYPLLAQYQPDLKKLGWESGSLKAVWDNLRGLDLLESLPFVDSSRGFATIGHSLGGHNSVFTAVFDDRLKVVVSSCGLDSFADYYDGNPKNWEPEKGWCQTRYMPKLSAYKGRLGEIPFDFHELIGALAPRHVFIAAPTKDANFRAASVDRIAAAARPIFKLHGVEARLRVEHPDCEHDFPPEMRDAAYQLIETVTKGKR